MRSFAIIGLLVFALSTPFAMADGGDDDHDHDGDHHSCPGRDCKPKTKEVCFNLVCSFTRHDNPHGFKNCRVASTFKKDVTRDGGEVEGDSNHHNNPQFEVTCDGVTIFNNSARRFTDLLGTRVQGETGPFPALLLPRGSLHSGANNTSGSHVSPAVLEVDAGQGLLRTQGQCHIWTGNP